MNLTKNLFLLVNLLFRTACIVNFRNSFNLKPFEFFKSYTVLTLNNNYVGAKKRSTFYQPVQKFSNSCEEESLPRKLLNLLLKYPTPKNLNYWWNFGSLSAFFLLLQIITGVLLSFWYVPSTQDAFTSVDFIMREVHYGWLIRYMHSNGASFFFACIYIHMAKALFYCSFTFPRQWVWVTGMTIFLLMMATAFLGYILPWGQMSYWAATVITSLVSTVPVVGDHLLIWIWGAPTLDQATLTRVYGLHFVLPFIIVLFVVIHIVLLHQHGSNNPLGFQVQNYAPFHPYFTLKDLQGIHIATMIFTVFVFFYPNLLSHPDNWIPADSNTTPKHIVPEWYFLPFYGILRSVPSKSAGITLLIAAILFLFFLPKLHKPLLRVAPFRPLYMLGLYIFFISFIMLGWSGSKPVAYPYYQICQIMSVYFFLFFLCILPFIQWIELRGYNILKKQSSLQKPMKSASINSQIKKKELNNCQPVRKFSSQQKKSSFKQEFADLSKVFLLKVLIKIVALFFTSCLFTFEFSPSSHPAGYGPTRGFFVIITGTTGDVTSYPISVVLVIFLTTMFTIFVSCTMLITLWLLKRNKSTLSTFLVTVDVGLNACFVVFLFFFILLNLMSYQEFAFLNCHLSEIKLAPRVTLTRFYTDDEKRYFIERYVAIIFRCPPLTKSNLDELLLEENLSVIVKKLAVICNKMRRKRR